MNKIHEHVIEEKKILQDTHVSLSVDVWKNTSTNSNLLVCSGRNLNTNFVFLNCANTSMEKT